MSYVYAHAAVVRVIDGDTVELVIDMGNHMRWTQIFRLYGIDTPEVKQAGHDEAVNRLAELLKTPLSRVETYKPDKYGRWLADLYIASEQGAEMHVNQLMVVDGYAKPYFGGKKQ